MGDFDGDGRLDLVITVLGDRPQLLHNVGSPDNGWLTLRLVGRASNRQGIGTADPRGQPDRSHDDQRGLCLVERLRRALRARAPRGTWIDVEVLWPSGVKQVLEHVAANRALTVTEPREK